MKKIKIVTINKAHHGHIKEIPNIEELEDSFTVVNTGLDLKIDAIVKFNIQEKTICLLSSAHKKYGIKFREKKKFRFDIRNFPEILSVILYGR